MLDFLPIIHFYHNGSIHPDPVLSMWLTVAVYAAAVVLLLVIGYLIFAKNPDGEDAFAALFAGAVCSVVWPIVLVLCSAWALIAGARWLVHDSPRAPITKRARRERALSRRDERIRELEKKNDKLEKQLGL